MIQNSLDENEIPMENIVSCGAFAIAGKKNHFKINQG